MNVRLIFFFNTGEKMLIGKGDAHVHGSECHDSSSARLQDIPVCPSENLKVQTDNFEIAALYNVISFFYSVCGRSMSLQQ